jgi:hypothetical protein
VLIHNTLCHVTETDGGLPDLRRAASASLGPNLMAGQANEYVATCDFNCDGVDVSAVLTASRIIANLPNDQGTALSTGYPVAGLRPRILTADFWDGFADLAATKTDFSGQGNMVVLLGKRDGSFQPATKYPTGSFAFYLAAGDFNGDGIADLATTNLPAAGAADGTVAVPIGKRDET